MPVVPLKPFVGINKDLSPEDLPMGAWTDAQNVRFRNGYAELFRGQVEAYPTAPIAPLSAFPVYVGTAAYWIALSATKAYVVTGTPAVWTDITRASGNYAATTDLNWNGGVLNGVPVLNNGIDTPQAWTPVATTQKLVDLPNWPTGYKARVVRPFKNYLFALGITTDAGKYLPHSVRWSAAADPGTLPLTWDATVSGSEAGQFDLEGASPVVDCLPLRGSLIVYKQNSTHVFAYVGGQFIFQQTLLFANSGMLAPDCAVEVEGAHVVLTTNDVIIHDGQTARSALDKVTRDWLFKGIDAQGFSQCFVTKNSFYNEVWVCFPELGETSCTRALVLNLKDGTSSFRQLPGVTSASFGPVDDSASNTYDGQTGSYDESLRSYNENEFGAGQERLLMCAPGRPALVLVDSGTRFFGEPISGYIVRTGITFGDPNTVKTIQRIRPRWGNTPPGSVFQIRAGASMTLDGAITWSPVVTYTVGTTFSADTFATGRFLAIQVISSTAASWRIDGMDIEYVVRGGY